MNECFGENTQQQNYSLNLALQQDKIKLFLNQIKLSNFISINMRRAPPPPHPRQISKIYPRNGKAKPAEPNKGVHVFILTDVTESE